MGTYSLGQTILARLLVLGEHGKAGYDRLKEEFPKVDSIPALDSTAKAICEILYEGGLCDFRSFDLKTHGEFHDAVAPVIESIGGLLLLDGILDRKVALLEETLKEIREITKERDRQTLVIELTKGASRLSAGLSDPVQAVGELRSAFMQIRGLDDGLSWDAYLGKAQQELVDLAARGVELGSGLGELDEKYLPRRGNLTTVAARTSHGKTAFCLHMTKQALQKGLKVAWLCFEDYHVFPYKIASTMFGVPVRDFTRYNAATPEQRESVGASLGMLRAFGKQLFIFPAMPMGEFESKVSGLGADLLIFDYAQKYAEQFGNDDIRRSTSRCTSEFQDIVRRSHAFGLMASQVRRTEGGSKGEPQLYDLKESGDIENYSDAVLLLHWPWKEGLDGGATQLDKEDYKIVIAKDKLGPCGRARVRYVGETLTYLNRFGGLNGEGQRSDVGYRSDGA